MTRNERVTQLVAHAIGLMLERGRIPLLGNGLEVAGDVLARECIEGGAPTGEEPVELTLRMGCRALEQHVLEKVGHSRRPRNLVPPADVVPDPKRYDRRVPRLEGVKHEAVRKRPRQGHIGGGDA